MTVKTNARRSRFTRYPQICVLTFCSRMKSTSTQPAMPQPAMPQPAMPQPAMPQPAMLQPDGAQVAMPEVQIVDCEVVEPESGISMQEDMRTLIDSWSTEGYLAFLEKHDMRPSHAQRIRSNITAEPRYIQGGAVRKYCGDYLSSLGTYTIKEAHRKLLKDPQGADMLMIFDGAPKAILLFHRRRRGSICLVHTHPGSRYRGFARKLAEAVKSYVPEGGMLTIDSPWCTARASVHLWIGAGFCCDHGLLSCSLEEDSAYDGGRSVRLTFTWSAHQDEEVRLTFLKRASEKHPSLSKFL
jgi:ribosomal protein S18 acetylase RimI-like enzyme